MRDHAESEYCGNNCQSQDAKCLALRVARKLRTIKAGSESRPSPDDCEGEGCSKKQREAFGEVVVDSIASVEDCQILHDVKVQEADGGYCPFAVKVLVN